MHHQLCLRKGNMWHHALVLLGTMDNVAISPSIKSLGIMERQLWRQTPSASVRPLSWKRPGQWVHARGASCGLRVVVMLVACVPGRKEASRRQCRDMGRKDSGGDSGSVQIAAYRNPILITMTRLTFKLKIPRQSYGINTINTRFQNGFTRHMANITCQSKKA